MTTFVRCSDEFIQDLVLATVESYHYGTGERRRTSHPSREIYGYIWGHANELHDEDDDEPYRFLSFERLQLSLSSKRGAGQVEPNVEALQSSVEMMGRLSPHMHLLGDFHTHPYPDMGVTEVGKNRLYDFSPADESSFQNDDLLWSSSGDQPVMTVATICEIKRTKSSKGVKVIQPNIVSFDIGQFRIWFNVRGGFLDTNEKRQEDEDIHVDLERRLSNIGRMPIGG